jgi:hypothetical protein
MKQSHCIINERQNQERVEGFCSSVYHLGVGGDDLVVLLTFAALGGWVEGDGLIDDLRSTGLSDIGLSDIRIQQSLDLLCGNGIIISPSIDKGRAICFSDVIPWSPQAADFSRRVLDLNYPADTVRALFLFISGRPDGMSNGKWIHEIENLDRDGILDEEGVIEVEYAISDGMKERLGI